MDHKQFKAALIELGISQHQLARDIEMDVTTVNRWANDKAEIPGVAAAYLRLRLSVVEFCKAHMPSGRSKG